MPARLEWSHVVVDEDLDGLGHANNISYLKWMQSAALAHSTAQGWSPEAYAALGCGWVVRSHFIEYLTPARLSDMIVVRTWVSEMGKVTSRRKFLILRGSEDTILAKAETNWAFIDYRTGVPKRIPVDVAKAFEVVVDDGDFASASPS